MKSATAPTLDSDSPTTSFDPDVALALGTVLRRYRESACIAQDVLPILAQVDRGFYGRLERGEKQPTVSVLLRIAKALGTTGAELLADAERELPPDWRADVERGSANSEALTAAMQRAAVRRAAVAKRASERKASARQAAAVAVESTQEPEKKRGLSLGQKLAGRPVRKAKPGE
ncbi:MAG: helix-turn-helix domain-containing protein [Pseudomonadota bacterium]